MKYLLSVFGITLILAGCGPDYTSTPIDQIVYAEPTAEARNFDLEAHYKSLPVVEYKKVDYPVKEVYTYEFNGHSLTVDVPEGFNVYMLPPHVEPRIVKSTGIEDSCATWNPSLCATSEMFWKEGAIVVSDDILCIAEEEPTSSVCGGIGIYPSKSAFTGLSYRDYYIAMEVLHYDYVMEGKNILVWRSNNRPYSTAILVDDQQGLSVGVDSKLLEGGKLSKDHFYSVVDSIELQK